MTYIVLGATGHVGSACAHALLDHGEPVIAVVHAAGKGDDLAARGAELAVVDVNDPAALAAVLRRGDRAFLLNPPADPTTDTDVVETASAAAIAEAAAHADLRKIVLASTGGAQPGDAIGDSSVLYELEQRLTALGVPLAIDRGGYYYSNWLLNLDAVRADGVLHTPFPADFTLPMIDPADLGRIAARRLRADDDTGVAYVEGPRRYTIQDVADAFAAALGRPVRVETVPREGIEGMFRTTGFSPPAARAYARMTEAALDTPLYEDEPLRGETRLEDYLARAVTDQRPSTSGDQNGG